ncbi:MULTISPECIES: hypothetical protein [Streptomyces]|jgi:hypothetical protein|uniref:Uncharacterized protein n=1 Tax=Streptomyces mirabilis TaxID=68239 RepID=A0ABU3V760_9ACTN|nr:MULTISPECIES: hypothetical protein [Streptomyces]MCX4617618.1 hypothetical protein [Streptomyces mirabilis]MCX5356906.1 hypothetical protein [Streptomyces mirabilis]MDU9002021.1 hypothetical protein [Streptomyces mirabilis]
MPDPQADYLEVLRLVKTGDKGLRSWSGVGKKARSGCPTPSGGDVERPGQL